MTPRHSFTAALVALSVLSLAACGGDEKKSDSTESSSPADLTVIGVEGIKWDKDSYTVSAGDVVVVEMENDSSLPHTLAIIAEDGTQIGDELSVSGHGDTDRGTYALAAGTYTIICTVPGHGNMKSQLIVS